MKFRITTICENVSPISRGLVAEHGFCLLIECSGVKILFDTGQGLGITNNAFRLGLNLRQVDYIVLSHGHYDHTGGLVHVLEGADRPTVIVHPSLFNEKYGVADGGGSVFIGSNFPRKMVESLSNLVFPDEKVEIEGGVEVLSNVEMKTDFEKVSPGLYFLHDGVLVPDMVEEELSLVLKTDDGMVIIVGCSHRGIINIVKEAIRVCGIERVRAIVGGFHLERATRMQISKTIEALKKFDVERVYVSHCTGVEAFVEMRNKLGRKVLYNMVGRVIEL